MSPLKKVFYLRDTENIKSLKISLILVIPCVLRVSVVKIVFFRNYPPTFILSAVRHKESLFAVYNEILRRHAPFAPLRAGSQNDTPKGSFSAQGR